MRFGAYLETKVFSILFSFLFLFFCSLFLFLSQTDFSFLFFFLFLGSILIIVRYGIAYFFLRRNWDKIHGLISSLEEKYYLAEVLPKPKDMEASLYYFALKKASQSMNERIFRMEELRKEYEDYIMSFVHEIKTPIAAISLLANNEKNETIKREIGRVNQYVEQILYYSRVKNPEKDYFISEFSLDTLLQEVLMSFQSQLLEQKVVLNIHDMKELVYSDEKWVCFVLSQILSNSLKYFDKPKKILEIYTEKKEHGISLMIKDNGCGISENDLNHVFDYGYTGSNRNKETATGMGLYLAMESTKKLGLGLKITSQLKKGTTVEIIFPIGKMHSFRS